MRDNLSEFLVDLVSNPDQMVAFLADPERVFDGARLTAEERDVVRSRDARRLSAALSDGFRMQSNSNNGTAKKTPRAKKPITKKKKSGGRKKTGGGTRGGRKKGGSR